MIKKSTSKKGFTLIEVMIIMLMTAVAIAITAPIMTQRKADSDNTPWKFTKDRSGDAYFSEMNEDNGDASKVFIGDKDVCPTTSTCARLMIRTTDDTYPVVFKPRNGNVNVLYHASNKFLLGPSSLYDALADKDVIVAPDLDTTISSSDTKKTIVGYYGASARMNPDKIYKCIWNKIGYTGSLGSGANGKGACANVTGESTLNTSPVYKTVFDKFIKGSGNTQSVTVGYDASASSGYYATAVGNNATATGYGSVAVGYGAGSAGDYTVSVGYMAGLESSNKYTVNIGYMAGYGVKQYRFLCPDGGTSCWSYQKTNVEVFDVPAVYIGYQAGYNSKNILTAVGYNAGYNFQPMYVNRHSNIDSYLREHAASCDNASIPGGNHSYCSRWDSTINVECIGSEACTKKDSGGNYEEYNLPDYFTKNFGQYWFGYGGPDLRPNIRRVIVLGDENTVVVVPGNLKYNSLYVLNDLNSKTLPEMGKSSNKKGYWGYQESLTLSNTQLSLWDNGGGDSANPIQFSNYNILFANTNNKRNDARDFFVPVTQSNSPVLSLYVKNNSSHVSDDDVDGYSVSLMSFAGTYWEDTKMGNNWTDGDSHWTLRINGCRAHNGIQLGSSRSWGKSIIPYCNMFSSDKRLKNISGLSTAGIDELNMLVPYNFNFKNDPKRTPQVGVVAQDLQKVFPDAVSEDENGFLVIRHEDMFYALVNAVKAFDVKLQELSFKSTLKRIVKLSKEVKELEAENAELKAKISDIYKRLEKQEKSL